jgi:hypothetical protein
MATAICSPEHMPELRFVNAIVPREMEAPLSAIRSATDRIERALMKDITKHHETIYAEIEILRVAVAQLGEGFEKQKNTPNGTWTEVKTRTTAEMRIHGPIPMKPDNS